MTDLGSAGWTGRAVQDDGPLPGLLRTGVCVIGAGLMGTSTALHLARAGHDVVLIDETGPAGGASGRGTGLMGPRWGPPPEVAVRRLGSARTRELFTFSERALRDAVALASTVAPGSVLPCAGQRVVARDAGARARLRRRAAAYERLGLPVRLDAARGEVLSYPAAAGVDPAALVLGLLDAARANGVRFHAGVTATSVDAEAHPPVVHTSKGPVRAEAVVVAADGDGLGLLAGCVLELQVHASCTDTLPEELVTELGGPAGAQVLDLRPLGPYRRLTADGRLVIGGGPATPANRSEVRRRAVAEVAWRWQRAALAAVHPALAEVRIRDRWSGRITLTGDGLPILRRLGVDGRVVVAGGWNGHGLVATLASSQRVATLLGSVAGVAQVPDAWTEGAGWSLANPRLAPLVDRLLDIRTPREG